jgi:RNA polymerase sigma factor (sigma-70 family)
VSVSLSVEGPGDAELISAVRGGEVDAYGELFARHVDAARRLARQLAGHADADDLVSDAFTKVLTVLQRGGGPDLAFRAYLLTAVRRLHVDKLRAGSRLKPVDDLTPFDPGLPFHDTAVEGFENAAAARAFASLPERWQMVLWHMEVEQQKPAEIAPLLGMSANSVSALAYRAREGLRQAFLSQHATDPDDVDCAWTRDHLGAYVRGGLSRRDAQKVDDHLAACRACAAVYLELTEVNSGLAALLAPLLLGAAGAGYLSSGGAGTGGALSTGFAAAKSWAAAHASLTAIGGLVVTATAVFSIYGASHLHGHNAADLGTPQTLDRPAATSTLPGSGNEGGQNGSQGTPQNGQNRGQSHGPNADDSSRPSTPTQSTGPGATPTSNDSAPPVGGPSNPTSSEPSQPSSSQPSSPTSSAPTTHPTNGPTNPPTNPPSHPKPITFNSTPPSNPTFGSKYRVTATGGSGHITFAIDPSSTNDSCTLVKPHVVRFQHAGKCVIAAHDSSKTSARALRSTHAAHSGDATQKIVIHRQAQSIDFGSSPPVNATVDGPAYPVRATGGDSGNPVTYSGNAACIVAGNTVSFLHAQSCTVTAHQDGNADYHAGNATQTFGVGKGTPTIGFIPPTNPVVDGPTFTAEVTSNSDGTIGYSVPSTVTACTLANDGVTLAFAHAGTCIINVHQDEGTDYTATATTETFTVGQGEQQITFTSDAPAHAVVGAPDYLATATGGDSGNDVTFSSGSANVCTVTTDGTVTFQHVGTCIVNADQKGNTDYNAAPQQHQQFTVAQGTQVIQLTPAAPETADVDDTYEFTATGGGSGNPVKITTSNNDVCTVGDSTVAFLAEGSCMITATQAGNDDYAPASTVVQTVKVVFPTTADLAVTAQNEGDQGSFTRVSGTVTGLPSGGLARLKVWPEGNYAVKPVDDQGACAKDGPADYTCVVTSEQTTFYFDVNVQPNGGSRTVDFDVTPVKPANDPDLRNNSFPLKLND